MYNHKFFKEKYSELMTSSSGTVHSLALIDIDNFKKVNDTYGHTTGDYVLREISDIIRSSIRASDIAARYGGEEFAILFPETSKSEGKIICERIRSEIESHVFVFNKFQFSVTISCGLSCTLSQQSEPVEVLFLESVDKLLYKAKNSGKNRVIYS
jgi:diguanylate cyclase